MRLILSLILIVTLNILAFAQEVRAGDTAPALKVSKWLGAPVKPFEKGKVYVVEFWATWCGPCVTAFPHLNKLVEETKKDGVVFVSITNEPEDKVREFLKEKPLHTQIALDESGATFKQYGVQVIPNTVIIGPDGKVASVTFPEHVTAQALRDVKAGKDPKLPVKTNEVADADWDKKAGAAADTSIAQVILQPSTAVSSVSRLKPGSGAISADGVGLRVLVMLAYGAEPEHIEGEIPNDTNKYRVSVKAPNGNDNAARAMLRQTLEASFPFTAQWVEVEKDVPVIRRTDAPLKLTPSQAPERGSWARSGHIEGIKASSDWLASTIGGFVYRTSAINETGLTGEYDFKLTWTPGNTDSFIKSLREMGLDVKVEKRKVKVLKVSGR